MNHPDAMIDIALDRQAERVREVQAYGLPARREPAAASWPMDDPLTSHRQPGRAGWGVAIAVLLVLVLFACVAGSGGIGGLLLAAVR